MIGKEDPGDAEGCLKPRGVVNSVPSDNSESALTATMTQEA